MTNPNHFSRPFFLLAFGLLCSVNLIAQINQWQKADQIQLNSITTAVPFLMIAPDSRSSAMGEAGLGLSTDANTLHWNPSNIAFGKDKFQASYSYAPWMRDFVPAMNFMYLSLYGKLNKSQAIGGSVHYFSLGEVADTTGNYNGNELAFDFTFAQKIGDHWSATSTGKMFLTRTSNTSGIGGTSKI